MQIIKKYKTRNVLHLYGTVLVSSHERVRYLKVQQDIVC